MIGGWDGLGYAPGVALKPFPATPQPDPPSHANDWHDLMPQNRLGRVFRLRGEALVKIY
jgi:hypothetical protein